MQLPKNFIKKIGALLSFVFVFDVAMIAWNVSSVLRKGPSMAILFANEYALTAVSVIASFVRFGMNCKDALDPEHPYENRSLTLFYLDFGVDLTKLLIYFFFTMVVTITYGIPIHILRDLYVTVLSFIRRAKDMINYHQVVSSLETRYPEVSEAELEALPDRTCIICREEMTSNSKRLPCGHCFHFKCLKSWIERQQVCPTCRKSVMDQPAVTSPQPQTQPPQSTQTTPPSETVQIEEPRPTPVRPMSPMLMPNVNSPSFASIRSHASPQFTVEPASFVVLPHNEARQDEDHRAALSPVIEAELERFGRRSPLRQPSQSFEAAEVELSPRTDAQLMSSLSSQIEYVEELLQEHQALLNRLRSAERLIRRSRSTSILSDRDEEDEKSSLLFNNSDHE